MPDSRAFAAASSISRNSPVVAQLADEPLLAELKRRARASWANGDYDALARQRLWPLGRRVVERIGVRRGERVLDVACGTGNAAIRAAESGAHVTALDLTPQLLEAGRALAADAGVALDWLEGDAESLPFADESFDVVLSTLGVMFAPRHRVAAHELVRVLRPGGRLALCNWAEDSIVGRTFRIVARHLPPSPAFAQPPWLWGSEEHVRSLFEGTGVELELERGVLEFPPFASAEEDVEYHSTTLGPLMAARAAAEARGCWPALRDELKALHDGRNSAEYLLVLGRRRRQTAKGVQMATTETARTQIDEARLEEVVGRSVTDMGAALNGVLVLLGRRLGLWQALAGAGPLTAGQLAARTGVREHYVHEWLGAQAASGYLNYDSEAETFTLPAEEALVFAEEESPVYMLPGYLLVSSAYKDRLRLEERLQSGDGFGWHEHHDELFAGVEQFFRPGYRTHLLTEWIPALDGVEARLRSGARVADVGCGHGVSSVLLAEAFPQTTVHGFDYHEGSIERARELARVAGVAENTSFEVASAKDFPGGDYDLVCFFDCLHDMGDPVGALRHVRDTLADDGAVMLVEPHAGDSLAENLNPVGRLFYASSTVFCTPCSLDQEVALGLGAQAGEQRLREIAQEAGFSRFRRATETPVNLVLEARP